MKIDLMIMKTLFNGDENRFNGDENQFNDHENAF